MRTIRVALCIDTVGDEAGTERYAAEVAVRLSRPEFDVHLCCLADSARLRELAECCAVRVFPLTRVFRPDGLRNVRALRRYLDEQPIDILHTFMPKATIAGVLAARGRVKAVVTSRRNLGYWYTPGYRLLFRWLNRSTTRVLANSEGVKKLTVEAERIAPEKVDVLYNGVDVRRFAAGEADRCGIAEGLRIVGIVANYRAVKDHALFLRAARTVAAAAPDTAFLLAGKGPLRAELGELARELGIGGRVFFSDGKGEVAAYLRAMSVGCLSSRSEGFSNAILEYMAAGLPVVATDVGGNGEAIEDGATGYLVRSREPNEFAAAILRLLEDEGKRAEMGRRGQQRCRERFDLEGAVRRQEEYYRSLV